METIITVILFIVGLVVIIKGGDWFVESAVWLAKVTGIPSVLIGATIVSIATTLPELLVSSIATYQQFYDVAIGNVVGSMACNIGLILGTTAILSPVKIKRGNFTIKSLFMLITAIVLWLLAKDKIITSKEGNILLVLFVVYIIMNILEFRNKGKKDSKEYSTVKFGRAYAGKNMLKFVLGAIFIIIGARLLVTNGVEIANLLGIPDQVISLTLIALGTSMPELITAITSIIKGHYGISIGNILGANVLNMVMVVGVSSKIAEQGLVISYQNVMLGATIYNIPQTLYLDLPVTVIMMTIIVLSGLIFGKISRWTGLLVLSIYCFYLFTLVKLFL
ncbi:calcium/sodium antiporter [Alkaliphilus peptidifermentans]|uniref:Cation:H+ antiporter n=1 Tax=Alkaliphilus peptidifermentans DSM 18978 TaxID=1120976 RepID=A0A1G5J8B1_9FIRM|nr:calcium/sodium antiporter [Alkaliphilus peptidifermentans]SCY84191.1 cation:H+ antiporter [Alkaliphilus peptidifermentans DSM 18978]